ncbi:MAG: hypothetical protein GXO50_06400 [Chlorobi bacterium]|nr:hypothetical protein [Chlorobiota bacterium]
MINLKFITLFFFGLFFTNIGFSQSDSVFNKTYKDTVILTGTEIPAYSATKKKAGKAAVLSALLPGSGQAYNEKYWKIPLVYSALGTAAFLYNYNNKRYKIYLLGYQQRIDPDLDETIFSEDIDTDVILQYKNNSRRNRDLSAVIFIFVYTLNIIDAVVDAELSDFDVSEDLSLKVKPEIMPLYGKPDKNSVGLTLCLNFK